MYIPLIAIGAVIVLAFSVVPTLFIREQRTLAAQHDNRTVITDDQAGMFAAVTGDVPSWADRQHVTISETSVNRPVTDYLPPSLRWP